MNYGVCIKKCYSSTTTSIDRLTDDLLLDILCKLPCYRTAVRCKTVSKRWRSLISSRLFVSHAFTMHRDIEDNKPQSCALLLNMTMWDGNSVTSMVVPPRYQRILSLQFLPYPTKIVATFKDLALCFGVDPWSGLGMYYVCNPITKQWMALPPYERDRESIIRPSLRDQLPLIRLNLLCQKGNDFRVVIVHSLCGSTPIDVLLFVTVNLSIYLSQTGKWKNVNVKIGRHHTDYNRFIFGSRDLTGVVCKETVCLRVVSSYFGAFNPFDVTDTFSGTLTAIPLPLTPRGQGLLFESNGKLIALEEDLRVSFDWEGCLANFLSWKLELNIDDKQPGSLRWEPLWVIHDKVELHGTVLTPTGYGYPYYRVIGLHPEKEHLIYSITPTDDYTQLVTFNTKLKTLEFSTRLLPHKFSGLNRLYMPNWPTPIRQSIAISKKKNNS
ncbi:hypothetical protein RND81_05G138500 [Saponaria officinalis]|uniref:F-box domain-containing protein n=1 Tax=Saponaria officinalis TaxID=3572 RepID=A0AAW1KSX4_SAPOF